MSHRKPRLAGWYLISADDARTVRAELLRTIEGSRIQRLQQGARHALHTLDSGLHRTAAVPADYDIGLDVCRDS